TCNPPTPCDPLQLAGQAYKLTGSIDSTATLPYVIPTATLQLTVPGLGQLTLTLNNVPLTISPPSSLTIAATAVFGAKVIPFTAVVNVSPGFASSAPSAFGSRSIAAGSTVTYGTAPATQLAATGT